MAESTLSLTYDEFRVSVGDYLGYGRTSGDWSGNAGDRIDESVQSGYRQFLSAHDWTFLKPNTTLTTADGTGDYTAPDDFGGLQGPMPYAANIGWAPVTQTGEADIRRLRMANASTTSVSGKPYLAAVQVQAGTGTASQKFKFLLYPEPDGAYVLTYRYSALQNKLTSAAIFPLGGALYSEVILQSMLAVAETRYNDEIRHHRQVYAEKLAQAIVQDGRLNQPEHLGRMIDNSDLADIQRAHKESTSLTVNGTTIW